MTTLAHHRAAASASADLRSRRSELKARVKAGTEPLQRLIAIPRTCLLDARIDVFLVEVPGVSATIADRMLLDAEVWGFATFGSLTREQRRRLIVALNEHEAGRRTSLDPSTTETRSTP